MSSNDVPLSLLAKAIEEAEGAQFRSILHTLRSPNYVDQSLLKGDLSVFVAKLLKLLRSSEPYQIWKGCHAVSVLCTYNPVVLCSQANQLLTVLYTRLESFVEYYKETSQSKARLATLKTLTKTVDIMMDLIRGKPTLTREALTPKLNSIIPLLITLSQYETALCLPILKKLLLQNTTTFKPFANKYRVILTNLITKEFQLHDDETQRMICENFALLHLIKQTAQKVDENQEHHKSSPDEHWRSGLYSILCQFKPLILLCGEMLDFSVDKELLRLVESLPTQKNETDSKNQLFGPLAIDMNESFTLWETLYRVEVLSKLLISFISLPTPFPLRIPLHGIISVCEALLMLTTNYLPLKRGLRRESELTAVIASVLRSLQYQGILVLQTVVKCYGTDILYYYSSILSSLELFIPIKSKGNTIDYDKVELMKHEFFGLLSLMNLLSKRLGHKVSEMDLFTKLTDITLRLTEDKSTLGRFYASVNDSKTIKQTTKQKKDFNKMAGAMSDVYSHPKQFINKAELTWYDEANNFLSMVIKNWKLPSTQQVSIIKYAVITSMTLKEHIGYIPQSFEDLLTTLVLQPGNERISILPIAVGLLKGTDNKVLDILCNPRLPFVSILNLNASALNKDARTQLKMPQEDESEDVSDNESNTNADQEVVENAKIPVLNPITAEETETTTSYKPQSIVSDPSQLLKKRSVEETVTENEDQETKRSRIEPTVQVEPNPAVEPAPVAEPVPIVQPTVSKNNEGPSSDSDSDSEIEIPAINVSDDEDEDDE